MKTLTKWKYNKSHNTRVGLIRLGIFATSMLAVAIVMGGLLGGCAIGFSNYRRSHDVSQQFEKGEIAAGYQYYVAGPESKPMAIVAIKADYRMQSNNWRKIELDNASLKALVKRISFVLGSEYKEEQMIPNGAYIVDADGTRIGMWYSVWDYSRITFVDDKVITIANPVARMPPDVRIPLD